jgi:hypothetical protein
VLSVFFDISDNCIVIIRYVRKSAVCTDFDRFAVFLCKARIAGAILNVVKRAVTEQAVHFLNAFMARVISAGSVLKVFE